MNAIHPYWLIAAAAAVAVIPMLAGLTTCYLKVNIVLTMIRSGLGTQAVPGTVAVMALSVAVSTIVMGPVFEESMIAFETATLPDPTEAPTLALAGKLGGPLAPWIAFMRKHSGDRELSLLSELRSRESSADAAPSPSVVATAFVLTELKEAFAMAFVLLLPFLVIDLVVANVLAGMGMFMVNPQMISLPMKIILFVLADGWLLITRGLVTSYGG